MIWKLQTLPIFWLPVPFNGQNLIDLTAWQFSDGVKTQLLTLTNPNTGIEYKVEILDYLGPYPMDAIPPFLARATTGSREMTGALLALLLRRKKPEFANTKKILFYQVNPIKTNGTEENKTNE